MLSQLHIDAATPPGGTILPDGATFRLWAPRATAVHLLGRFAGATCDQPTDERLMTKDATGTWTGFQPGARDGDPYRFHVTGTGSIGAKRDPYARELSPTGFPNCDSILRAADAYPWHDADFRTPDFADMVIYQLHVGTYAIRTPGICATFLDVAARIPYLAALGVNVLQPLPIDEQENDPSMGYGGADLFSPDFPYLAPEAALPAHLATLNAMLAAKGLPPLKLDDVRSGTSQLKALVDLCHVHGIAVTFDVVYNHAGGFSVRGRFDDNCLYYLDRAPNRGDNNDSLYFTDQDRGTGGLAFALWNADVCRFLIENACFYRREYHADGFRFDEISALLSTGQGSGWQFCRLLTDTLRRAQPRLLQNAEFWPGEFADIPTSAAPIVAHAAAGGAGFDVVQHDALRGAVRAAVGGAAYGSQAAVSMTAIAEALYPAGLDHAWRAVACVENHDLVMAGRSPRLPALADGSDHRSWYARSRSRVATALLLTAPGIPQLFMGQEFLESQPWDTLPDGPNQLDWVGLEGGGDLAMTDHLRFTRELVALRMRLPALRGDRVRAFHASDADRVVAFHRWLDGSGQDVVVVATLADSTWYGYRIGFPFAGDWVEVFNSDVYDHWVNPMVAGNGGGVHADAAPLHGFAASAALVIPANGVVVFARAG
jgi:1,4-alpha-glucan branching enzyme